MTTNYKVTTPKQFFQSHNQKRNQISFIDQLGLGLKTSINTVWNIVKNIDIRDKIQSGIKKQFAIEVNTSITSNNKQQTQQNHNPSQDIKSNLSPLIKSPACQASKLPFPSLNIGYSTKNKKQQLLQKKSRKIISFQDFQQQQNDRLNESFIKKNIEKKKALNRSIIMGVNNSQLEIKGQDKQNQKVQEVGLNIDQSMIKQKKNSNQQQQKGFMPSQQNLLQNLNSLAQPQEQFLKQLQQPQHQHNKNPYPSQNIIQNPSNQLQQNPAFLNQSLILNISDIDSQCNFNIMNNSFIEEKYITNGNMLKKRNRNSLLGEENYQDEEAAQKKDNKNGVLKFQHKEYPDDLGLKGRINSYNGERTDRNIDNNFVNNAKVRNHNGFKIAVRGPQSSTLIHNPKQNPVFNLNKKPQNSIIDVDNIPQLDNINQSQPSKPHKKVKKTIQHNYDSQRTFQQNKVPIIDVDGNLNNQEQQQNCQNQQQNRKKQQYKLFDELMSKKYDKYVEDVVGMEQNNKKAEKSNNSQQHKQTIKQDYEKFLNKNFGAMLQQKYKLEKQYSNNKKQAPISSPNAQGQAQPSNQNLKKKTLKLQNTNPLNLHPQIQRKKLYKFTKQMQTKIQVEKWLKKSVTQDKQRQQLEKVLKIQQEDRKAKLASEMQRMRRQREQKIRRQQEELEKKKLQAQEQQRQQQQATTPQQAHQIQQLTTLQKKSSSQSSLIKPYSQHQKPLSGQKQSGFAPYSPIPQPTSLFTLKQFKQPSQSKPTQSVKQQIGLNKKTESNILQKQQQNETKVNQPNDEVLKNKSPQLTPKESEKQSSVIDGGQTQSQRAKKNNPFLQKAQVPLSGRTFQTLFGNPPPDSMFKSVSPPPQSPINKTPNSLISNQPFMSPLRNPSVINQNPSYYSNAVDSSMCQQQQSNLNQVNGGGSQYIGNSNNILNNGNQSGGLNGSFIMNNSFSSVHGQANIGSTNMFQQKQGSGSLFGPSSFNPPSGLFGGNTGGSGLFNKNANSGVGMGFSVPALNMNGPTNKQQAVTQVPSFMHNNPSSWLQNSQAVKSAVSMFSQKSPTKQQQSSLFAPPPPIHNDYKRKSNTRERKREQRVGR